LLDTNTGDKIEWVQVDSGVYHTVGLTKSGEVFSWGSNSCGQLGHGDEKNRTVPTKVESLDGLLITKISCGEWHTAALTDKGEILTWYVLNTVMMILDL
jgi:alpha-tubulin suppressor-like RCC1 family protein